MDVDELRLRGNNLYSANEFNSAIDVYSEALKVSPDNAIILGNRSACYLATGQPEKAEHDARLAITIEPTLIKCYFRLATALKARNALNEAIEIIDLGLLQNATSVALRNFRATCIKEKSIIHQSQINSEKDGIAIKRGFLQQRNRYSKDMDDYPSKDDTEMLHDMDKREIGPVEQLMITELKSLIKRILTGSFGSEDMNKHMLHGVFKQLMDKETFAEVLFPGASEVVQRDLPMNLKDLLSWDILSLDLNKIAGKAASIFDGIKSKGEKRGDFMDHITESILIPQIVEEAMARDIVETVRNLSKRVSGLNAKVSLALALPSEEEASWDQIGLEVSGALGSSDCALGVQPDFLGIEWSLLVLDDVIRFVADEKMTGMDCGTSMLSSPNSDQNDSYNEPRTADEGLSRMAWIEQDAIADSYPALGELLQQLHALPYEINEKSNCALRLLQPARGCTMIVHFSAGSIQPLRMDNRENEFDSGIRVTCAYQLVPSLGPTRSSGNGSIKNNAIAERNQKLPVAQLLYTVAGTGGHDGSSSQGSDSDGESSRRKDGMKGIDVEHDQLILHQSVKVKNARSAALRDYFVIYYFIHGK